MDYTEKLKDLRFDMYEKQEDVAKLLNITRSSYNNYENQFTLLPIKYLETLCEHFEVSVDYFLSLSDTRTYDKYNKIDKIKAGNRLKEFRIEHKLTKKELATFLNTVPNSIAWNEKGRNLISLSFLYMICSKYKISADYLLGRIDKPKYLE